MTASQQSIKPANLRGILEYVPQFRYHTFVIAMDGSIVAHENCLNVMTDIAVLRSLNINVLLVYGIGKQLKEEAQKQGASLSDVYGEGPTDPTTLELARQVSAYVCQQLAEMLTQCGLRFASTNAVHAQSKGILKGEAQGASGVVDKSDCGLFHQLMEREVVPLAGPVAFSREGASLRVNSDQMAAELAIQLKASKLIYLTPFDGLRIGKERVQNIPAGDLRRKLSSKSSAIEPRLKSKCQYATEALESSVPRVHLLDGRVFGGLLTEIFDKVGIGTMIHADEYQQIRPARRKDLQHIYNITRSGARTEALKPRTRQALEKELDHFYVYEIDESIIGCSALLPYSRSKTMELANVYVHNFYEGKGVGRKLVEYALKRARERKASKVIALSTKAYDFFTRTCGFHEGSLKDLPSERRQQYEQEGRHPRILVKTLNRSS